MDQRDGFEGYVVARARHLRHLAYGLCGDWHAADDLLQTTLTKLYVAWPKVHRRGAEDAYARKILLRAAIDDSRRPWRREAVGIEGFDRAAPPDPDVGGRHDLVNALTALPAMQRNVVVLRHWVGLSVTETAAELGIGEGTVKSHTSRALQRLHDLMSSEEGSRS